MPRRPALCLRLSGPTIDPATASRRGSRARPAAAWLPAEKKRAPLLQREGDDGVAPLVVELDVAAGCDHDVLLAVHHVGRRRRIDASAGVERPQHLAVLGALGAEAAAALAGEPAPARPCAAPAAPPLPPP